MADCEHCQHPGDPHALIATRDDPTLGGVMFCPVPGCECFSTWAVPPFSDQADVLVPVNEELLLMRSYVQGVSLN